MIMQGQKIDRLDQMIPGQIYAFIEIPEEQNRRHRFLPEELITENGNVMFTFVFLKKIMHEPERINKSLFREVTYLCDILEVSDGDSSLKFFESIDQDPLDKGIAGLYHLT